MSVAKRYLLKISQFYETLLTLADPRVEEWPLMRSCLPTLSMTVMYLILVYAGMKYMSDRKPLKLRYTLVIYNCVMVVINLHIFFQLLFHSLVLRYDFLCQAVNADPSNESEIRIAAALWWFYISKLFEFCDTFFFVLRKKNDQISFLHVYHHSSMFPIWWIGVKWLPGGSAFFGPMINSLVHVIMYLYYGLSVLGPSFHRFIFWKKYLTKLQLTQFLIGIVWGLNMLVNGCAHIPTWMIYGGMVYGLSMISLFLNFYYRAYTLKGRLAPRADEKQSLGNGHQKFQ